MGKIEVMDTQLANMIAAGEVVERPASVVKELVENSIDANASKIEIHLHDSGLRQIKVIDNGDGMAAEDVHLAFKRHATSKVRTQHDIMRIQTLGFRGEALPSIASVADVRVSTSDGASTGTYLNIKAGKVLTNEPGALRKGTEMEVNHLFFNTPARLKHVKSLNTELAHITDYVNRTALARPDIAFELHNNGRQLFKSSGRNDLHSVIAAIYGFDMAKKMNSFESQDDDFKISGLISNPSIHRASRNYITIIVNNRPVKNFEIVRIILNAYHTFLPKDKYPIVTLNINLDPLLVDVNVHPAKLEVRFSKEEALKSFIYTEIQKTLKDIMYVPTPTLSKPIPKKESYTQQILSDATSSGAESTYTQKKLSNAHLDNRFEVREGRQTYGVNSATLANSSQDVNGQREDNVKYTYPIPKPSQGNISQGGDLSPKQPYYRELDSNERVNQDVGNSAPTPETMQENPHYANQENLEISIPTPSKKSALELYYIGQLHGTYLLAQNEEGLFLIDQHAAMERVEYEKNYPLLGNAAADSMELLVPLTLTYPAKELLMLREKLDYLAVFGFDVEEFGSNDLVVRSVPVWAAKDAKAIVETLVEQLLRGGEANIAKLREAVAITMSCKGSIKANQYINEHEIQKLLENLCKCEQPYTCPHGRPIIVKMTKYEIERLFKRA